MSIAEDYIEVLIQSGIRKPEVHRINLPVYFTCSCREHLCKSFSAKGPNFQYESLNKVINIINKMFSNTLKNAPRELKLPPIIRGISPTTSGINNVSLSTL